MKTWNLKDEIVIRSDGFHGDLDYPGSTEVSPNRILMVYYGYCPPQADPPVADNSYA